MKSSSGVIRRVITLFLAVALSCLMSVPARAATLEEVATVLDKLQSAYNNKDLMGIADCFAYNMSGLYSIAGKLMGLDQNVYTSLLPIANGLFGIMVEESDTDWSTCELTPLEYAGDDYAGTLTYHVHLVHPGGSEEDFDSELKIKKYESEWRIDIIQNLQSTTFTYDYSLQTQIMDGVTDDDLMKPFPDRSWRENADKSSRLLIFYNEDGKPVLTVKHALSCKDDCDGYIPIESQEVKLGLMDHFGQIVLKCDYKKLEYVGDGFWKIMNSEGKWGLANLKTGEGFSCRYRQLGIPCNGYIQAQRDDNLWSVVSVQGEAVAFNYTNMSKEPVHGLLEVSINQAKGIIDYKGEIVLKPSVTANFRILPNGLIGFYKDGGFVITDRTGKECMTVDTRVTGTAVDPEHVYMSTGNYKNEDGFFLDSDGNVTADLAVTLAEQDSLMRGFKLYPDTFDGEWMAVEIYREGAIMFNLVNLKGELRYAESIQAAYQMQSPGQTIYLLSHPVQADCILMNDTLYMLGTYTREAHRIIGERYYPSDNRDNSVVYDLVGLKKYTFYNISAEPSYIIVSDGAYSGLITKKGLFGDGLDYLSVGYGASRYWTGPRFSLKELSGAVKEIYVIANGSVINVNDQELEVTPLSDSPLEGEPFTGIPLELADHSGGIASRTAEPEPVQQETETPVPETPVPETPVPATPAPETPAPAETEQPVVTAEPTEAPDTWICENCGQAGNPGRFCMNCGQPSPAPAAEPDTWICENCGQTGNRGNFCSNCGHAAPADDQPETWTCENCGQAGVTGNFCLNCGHPAPAGSPDASDGEDTAGRITVEPLAGTGFTNKPRVNVRSGPSQTAEILTVWETMLRPLDVTGFAIDADGTGWYRVLLPDQRVGFIRSDLLDYEG